MDLEEEIAMLKKENENLKFKNHKLEFQLSNPTFDDDSANEIIGDRNEEINKLKKENEELKDGENTAKMIDKLNDEFSELQDKNMKLEEEIAKEVNEKERLEEKYEKLEEEMDLLYDYTDYPEDMLRPDYSKADGIGEWMDAREDEISDLQSETRDLEEKNKELKKEKECSEEELKTIEGLLRIFAKDNKLPDESLDCQGCRIRQIGFFIVFMIDNIRKEKETVVQATPIK